MSKSSSSSSSSASGCTVGGKSVLSSEVEGREDGLVVDMFWLDTLLPDLAMYSDLSDVIGISAEFCSGILESAIARFPTARFPCVAVLTSVLTLEVIGFGLAASSWSENRLPGRELRSVRLSGRELG